MAAPDDFAAWLRLLETPGLGSESARRLLAAFGSPDALFAASPGSWREVAGSRAAAALLTAPPGFAERLAQATRWLRDGDDRHALTLADAAYPQRLLQTADPPMLLFAAGRLELLASDGVAIVGSRKPTVQGLDNARNLARQLAGEGFSIVSGLAAGIDGAAHEGALAAPGDTIAVVGTGLDIVYPAVHRKLAQRISASGLMLSEFNPGTPALPDHFPRRNRIIAGLTLGTLVVEAALRSGSLITARLALEAGREVFAVPGSIHSAQSQGCHALIKQGATLVEKAADILDELRGLRLPANAVSRAMPDTPLLSALGHDPVTLDSLMARTGWPAAELSGKLLELELEGAVARLPGGLYQRRHAG